MQPYLFPYFGYFQLISGIDQFIFLDDVNFIQKGWINRNRILVNGETQFFTAPLKKASQNEKINALALSPEYAKWKPKFLKTLEINYKKSPSFDFIFPQLQEFFKKDDATISDLAKRSILFSCNLLDIKPDVKMSSTQFENADLKGEDRIMNICQRTETRIYRNLPGGREVYSTIPFKKNEIRLEFLTPQLPKYPQILANQFIPGLSILDLLFNCDLLQLQKIVKTGVFTE